MQEWYDLRDGHRHLLAHHAARPQDVPKLDYLPLSVVHWHAITVLHATRGNRSRSRSRLATEAQITTRGGHRAWPAGSRHAPGARERMIAARVSCARGRLAAMPAAMAGARQLSGKAQRAHHQRLQTIPLDAGAAAAADHTVMRRVCRWRRQQIRHSCNVTSRHARKQTSAIDSCVADHCQRCQAMAAGGGWSRGGQT